MAEKEGSGAAKKAESESKRGYVQYIGLATYRGITKADWERLGIMGQKDVWFTPDNHYRIDRAYFSGEAYKRAVRRDPLLALIGGDAAEGSLEENPYDKPPAEMQTPMPDPELYGS